MTDFSAFRYVHPPYVGTQNFVPIKHLEDLPETLDYTGEFGLELLVFLPFVTWAAYAGLLGTRRVRTHRGMGLFYMNLPIGTYEEKDDSRCYIEAKDRPFYLPVKDEHTWDWQDRSPFHCWRDHRLLFKALDIPLPKSLLEKPLLIIHNKYNDEWGRGPINFIPVDVLDTIIKLLKDEFSIVYIRHGMGEIAVDYSSDHNHFLSFNDVQLLSGHPDVYLFDDLYSALSPKYSVNEFKNFLYAKCYYFFSAQGGGAHHCALFSGSMLAINHVWGPEIGRSYGEGFYSFLSNPAPLRLVALAPEQLIMAAQAMLGSKIINGRVNLKTENLPQAEALAPDTQKNIYYSKQKS